jgi:hypothetical protein
MVIIVQDKPSSLICLLDSLLNMSISSSSELQLKTQYQEHEKETANFSPNIVSIFLNIDLLAIQLIHRKINDSDPYQNFCLVFMIDEP